MSAKTRQSKKAETPVWSEELQAKAASEGKYIKIGARRGMLSLTGAKNMWAKNPNVVYVSELRVAGTPEDIRAAFEKLGFDVADQLAAAYTSADQESEEYKAELAELKAARPKTARAPAQLREDLSIADYAKLVEKGTLVKPVKTKKAKSPAKKTKKAKKAKSPAKKTKSAKKAKKSPAKKSSKKATKSPKRAKSPKSRDDAKIAEKLRDRVAGLAAGKALDVSGLTVDGQGAKTVSIPENGFRTKVMVPGYPVVSDNKNGIKKAAKMLGDEGMVDAWERAKKEKAAVKASPTRKARKSPTRKARKSPKAASPAKALPMSPRRSGSRASSPTGSMPALPSVRASSPTASSPRSSRVKLGSLPSSRPASIGSPGRSPRM